MLVQSREHEPQGRLPGPEASSASFNFSPNGRSEATRKAAAPWAEPDLGTVSQIAPSRGRKTRRWTEVNANINGEIRFNIR
jgi:hypothetical protein